MKRHTFRHTQEMKSLQSTMNTEKIRIMENPSGPTKTLFFKRVFFILIHFKAKSHNKYGVE